MDQATSTLIAAESTDHSAHAALDQAKRGSLELVDLLKMVERLDAAGRKQHSIELYRTWIEHTASPLAYFACFNLGVALANENELAASEDMYRKALALKPDLVQALLNLGNNLERQGRADEALEQWRKVLSLPNVAQPENKAFYLHALNNLGRLLEIRKSLREALEMLETSLSLDPTQKDVLYHIIHLRQKQCLWPVHLPPKGVTETAMMEGTSPLAMVAALDDPALQLTAARGFVAHKYEADNERLAPTDGYGHGKIRIGYLSSDLCLHPVALLTVELFELHDRERFEVYSFCWSREDGSSTRTRVIAAMDHFIRIGGMSDREAAECIRSHEIDILIDLQGLTSGARPIILSYRPAPVQATYLGFTGTTALPWIDYVVVDRYLLPDELAPYFTEKPLRLPECFQVSDRKRDVGPTPTRIQYGLPQDAPVFCSFNNNYKITQEMFALWMRVLKRTPGSVLWLLADNEWVRENLGKAAQGHGVEKERLIFAPRVSPADYLARYRLADLFLDTFPFNGGTTANDALFMGLPLLTCSGRTFASRMAGSLLNKLGMTELISTSLSEYEERAVELGGNREYLKQIKMKLEEAKETSPVFDIPAVVKAYENALAGALNRACSSRSSTGPGDVTANRADTRVKTESLSKKHSGANMKVVIFAGGMGTRISEESYLRPKPMIEIGEKPILWHIMKIFESQGFNEFIICLGYKGFMIKQYFMNYYLYNSDVTLNLQTNSYEIHQSTTEKLRVTLVETGLNTMTAGRLKRVQQYVGKEEFFLTYGDGLADVNLDELLSFHHAHGKLATVTAVQPGGRFGLLGFENDSTVSSFKEKPVEDGGWINGGFFVLSPEVFSYLPEDSDTQMWEQAPLETLAQNHQLVAYKHHGFWKCMDALRDKEELEQLWKSGHAQWKTWE